MGLKLAATVCGAIGIFLGLLTKLSYNPVDQRIGNLAIGACVAALLFAFLASGTLARIAQWSLCCAIAALAIYVVVARMGQ